MRRLRVAAVAIGVGAWCNVAVAQIGAGAADSPLGVWQSIDDQTGAAKAIVRIDEQGGVYRGRIERLLGERADATCKSCTDARRDQPIKGMTIIENMRANPDNPAKFEGGSILDPETGKVYRSQMRVVDGGRKLEVRGYVGTPMFGRTQTWTRP